MRPEIAGLLLVSLASCALQPSDSSESFSLATELRPLEGECEGTYLLISSLQPDGANKIDVWDYEANGHAGLYKVHYSTRVYYFRDGECQRLEEIYVHGEMAVTKYLRGGIHYLIREASNGKVVVSESKM